MKTKKRITGSTFFKIFTYFLLAVSFLVGVVSTVLTISLLDGNAYHSKRTEWIDRSIESVLWEDIYLIQDMIYSGEYEWIAEYCEGSNVQLEIIRSLPWKDVEKWSNYYGDYTPYSYQHQIDDEYFINIYLDADFPEQDKYRSAYLLADGVYKGMNVIPLVAVISVLVAIFSFIFLMCAAGHKNGEDGIVPSVLAPFPLDILTVLFVTVACIGLELINNAYWQQDMINYGWKFAFLTLECIWCTIYCMELANRMKRGNWWKHSLIYMILRFLKRIFWRIGWFIKVIVTGIPMSIDFLLAFLAISIAEFMGLLLWGEAELGVCWILEKMVLLPVLLYVLIMCRKLQQGSEALAKGDLNFKLNTKGMVLDLKEHADNLNCARDGIERAVEERMKSEHLKTELITNVSHDIKTPLTSIINYADLLGNAVALTGDVPDVVDKAQIEEYAEVLLRQSKRMKKLLDDLVEASKATTGNMEVHLVPCEISVLLSQAVGEYEQRFEEKDLSLVVKQIDATLRIAADGRHLWRVFDNLMNNICKYALENTRVYLTVESKEGYAEIAFRNISKYPLELSAEELEERFVRGDKSRHMEGSGLGLSIAKSLTGLQNGSMEIMTDGDLFKVILRFKLLEE